MTDHEVVIQLLCKVLRGDARCILQGRKIDVAPFDGFDMLGVRDVVDRGLVRTEFHVEIVAPIDETDGRWTAQDRYEFAERMADHFMDEAACLKAALSGDARPDTVMQFARDMVALITGELDPREAENLAKRAKALDIRPSKTRTA